MSKLLIASLAACGMLAAQTMTDGAGVTVQMNGASLMHRTGVSYPAGALQRGVEGTVSLELKLDSAGNVSDAQVLSGPDELRRASLESVLQWHLARELAGTTRMVQIVFQLPKVGPATVETGMVSARPPMLTQSVMVQASAASRSPSMFGGRIQSIRVVGMSERVSAELLASLPIHEGDELNQDLMRKASEAVRAFDEHLGLQMAIAEPTAQGDRGMGLVIAPRGSTPDRIKVGGNVQSAMILKKVAPVYPPAAKAAGISGIVRLAAVIGKDGAIQSLSVLDGPAELTQAALDAVKQWVYRPTMLNGEPVDVDTTVDINFTLSQ